MELTVEELQFLNSILAQINPQGLEANVTRVQLWTKVQQELQEKANGYNEQAGAERESDN